MKVRLLFFFVVLQHSLFPLSAKEIYPWKSYGLESSWSTGSIASPWNGKTGGGFYTGLALRDLFPRTRFGTHFAYNYLHDGGDLIPILTYSLDAAYSFRLNNFITIWPTLESTAFVPFQSEAASGCSIGAVVDLHLFDRNYLSLEPMFSLPLESSLSPYFGFRIGVKHSFPVLRKLPPPKMKVLLSSSGIRPDKDDVTVNPYKILNNEILTITTTIRNPKSFKNWLYRIEDDSGFIYKSWDGKGAPPEQIIWKKNDHNIFLLQYPGSYRLVAEASDLLGNRLENSCELNIFIPPARLSLSVSPKLFSPDEDGKDDVLNIRINTENENSLASWQLSVLDERGRILFREFGIDKAPELIQWDGIDDLNVLVSSVADYRVILEYQDIFGENSSLEEFFSTDLFIYEDDGKKKIRVPGILFPPDSADFSLLDEEECARNTEIILKLAAVLNKFNSYRILIEGHGNLLSWNDPELSEWEKEQELIPLSKQRAESVRHLLIKEGIAAERLYVLGAGGSSSFPSGMRKTAGSTDGWNLFF